MRVVRSDITYLQNVGKFGAYGDVNSFGSWLYGKRPDGRTVPVKRRFLDDGIVEIYSETEVDGEFIRYVTQFTSDEWLTICLSKNEEEFRRKVNVILFTRPRSAEAK